MNEQWKHPCTSCQEARKALVALRSFWNSQGSNLGESLPRKIYCQFCGERGWHPDADARQFLEAMKLLITEMVAKEVGQALNALDEDANKLASSPARDIAQPNSANPLE